MHLEAGVDVGSAVQVAIVVEHELVRQFAVQRLHVIVCAVAATGSSLSTGTRRHLRSRRLARWLLLLLMGLVLILLNAAMELLVEKLHPLRVDAARSVASSGNRNLLLVGAAHFHVLLIVVF